MKIALSDDRGLLEQAAGRDVEGEPDELGVRPGQRGSRGGAGTRCKAGLAGGRLVIPDLLRQQITFIRGKRHGDLGWRSTKGNSRSALPTSLGVYRVRGTPLTTRSSRG